jgi:hypothetical protein
MVTPDYAAAVDFLRRFHPGRLWALTAIHPDQNYKPRTATETFDEQHATDAMRWLEKYGTAYNLYFSVAEPLAAVTKKCERTDIARVWYLHVDVDPRTGEPLPDEQQRIAALLAGTGRADVIPGKLPVPPIRTYSGGGYQGFWPLETPIEINGELARAEDAKLYNLAIELAIGADKCHNIDRIMRLPGTINRPDKNKRSKGRVESLAAVVEFGDEKFPINRFSKAQPIGTPPPDDLTSGKSAGTKYQPPANVKRLDSLDNLAVADWLKVLTNQGYDPKDPNPLLPKRYPSRSEALFAVVCGLKKANVDEDTIFSIITDERFGISASVIELGSRAERYARRQIDRAREEIDKPWLHALNEKYFVVESYGGKCRVCCEAFDSEMGWRWIEKQTLEDFTNAKSNLMVQVGVKDDGTPKMKPLGEAWLDHPHRRQYEKIAFAPNQDVDNAFNLWRGFSVDAKPGNCRKYLAFVWKIICGGDRQLYQWVLDWMSYAVQHPEKPAGTAIVLTGGQGIGKTFFVKTFGRLFGFHFKLVTDDEHVVGHFNAHMEDAVVVLADEAFFAGNKKHANILKSMITADVKMTEGKGIDARPTRNCIHLFIASNNEHVVHLDGDDRRYLVLDVSERWKERADVFGKIAEQMQNGGYEALLHLLKTRDLKDFSPHKPPLKTKAKDRQQIQSLEGAEAAILELFERGELPPGLETVTVGKEGATVDSAVLLSWCRRESQRDKITYNSIAYILDGPRKNDRKRRPGLGLKAERRHGNGAMCWMFPPLDECRAAWCKIRFDYEWRPKPEGWTQEK